MQRSVAQDRFLASRSYSIEDERLVILNRIATQGVKAAADGNNDFVKNEMKKAESVIDDSLFTINRFLEASNEAGHNMLHAAIIHKRPKVIDILLDYGNYLSNSLTNDENGDTPLTLAIRTYKNTSMPPVQAQDLRELTTSSQPLGLEIIRILIRFGSKINAENSKGDTPLILATKLKNHDVVKELCNKEDLRVNHKNICGKTALHYAVAFNLIEIADSLFKYGASVLEADNDGYTPVHIACKYGRENMMVEMFTEMLPDNTAVESKMTKAIVDSTTNDGKTPLLVARCALNPSSIIVKMLIKKGSDLEIADHFGNTALHLFSSKDDVDSCTRIFNRAKNLGIKLLEKKNISLEIPLHVAASFGHLKVCYFFMENDSATLICKDIHGYTPIMKAIANGHQAVVKEMLVFHCKVTAEVQPHKTLLEWAIENEYSVLIKAMHSMCVDRQEKMEEVFENITVPYLATLAAKFGKDKILQSCIHIMKHGCKILQENAGTSTDPYYKILRKSVKHGNLNCVKVVFKHTEKLSGLKVVDNDTLLHIACRKGYIEIVKYLLGQSPADPNICNCTDGLPISCAASNGHEQLVEYLLDNGALLTKPCPRHKSDRSPLLQAAMGGHERVVEILLKQKNVDVNVRNSKTGYNCLCEAIMRGHRSTALAILKSTKWKQAMRFRGGSKNETPLRMMIQYMPDLAELALYQCITEEEHEHEHKLKKITYSFEFLEDCKTCDGVVANFVGQKMKWFSSRPANGVTAGGESLEERTTVFINRSLDSSSYTHMLEEDGGENGQKNDKKWLQPGYDKDNDVLQLMVKHKRISLLKHPLVSELLNYKWRCFGLPAYIFHFTFYVMVVALLTSMILVTPLPHGPVCSIQGCWSDWGSWSTCGNPTKCDNFNVTRTRNRTCNMPEPGLGFNKGCHGNDTETMVCSDDESNSFSLEANSSGDTDDSIIPICKDLCRYGYSNFKNMSCQQKGISEAKIYFLEVGTTILLVIVIALIALNAHKCYRRRMIYFKDLTTYIEATLSLATIVFITLYFESSNNCFCANISTWEAAVVAVFFGWIGLIIHLTKFPLTGIIINMLLSIFYTFLKLVIIAVLLCFAFALPLYMLLTQPGRRTPFSDIGRSMLKTLVMTTGEFEFDTIFVNEQELVDADLDLLFPTLTTIIWVIFVVTMPILFNNLLVGLAVGDTKEQLDNAQLTKFQLQIRIITEIQKALPVIHLIKRNELVVSRNTCSWVDWLFYSTPRLQRKQAELHEWKSKAEIIQIFDEHKRDDPVEKLIAMQNEKLNRLENLLKSIVKGLDDERALENERSQEPATVMANELSYSVFN